MVLTSKHRSKSKRRVWSQGPQDDFTIFRRSAMAEVTMQISIQAQNSLLQNAFRLRTNGSYCDTVIHMGDKAFSAHKLILVSFSKYFADYFRLLRGKQLDIVLPGVNPQMFSYVLDFMYGQEIKIPTEYFEDFLWTARKLEILDLIHQWHSRQRKEIDIDVKNDYSSMKQSASQSSLGSECESDSSGDLALWENDSDFTHNVCLEKSITDHVSNSSVGDNLGNNQEPTSFQEPNLRDTTMTKSCECKSETISTKKFFCVTCKSFFSSLEQKCQHFLTKHCSGKGPSVTRMRILRKSQKDSKTKKIAKRSIPKHVCYHCFKSFICMSSLLRHFKLKHRRTEERKSPAIPKGSVKVKVSVGTKTLKKNSISVNMSGTKEERRKHRLSEITRNLNKCEQCSTVFEDEKDLVEHLVQNHGRGLFVKTHYCLCCSKRFNVKEFYRWHNIRKHEKHIQVCTEEGCDFVCDSVEEVTSHLKEKHGTDPHFKCHICNYTSPVREYVKKHIEEHYPVIKGKKYFCDICPAQYKVERGLLQHKYSKHGLVNTEKAIRCTHPGCSYLTYHSPYILKNHVLAKHSKEKTFLCQQCNRSFSNKNSLTCHISKTHKSRYLCSCPNCGKRIQNVSLKMHLLRCTGDSKTFMCTHCDYSSYCKVSLECHEFSKHGVLPSNGKVYNCEQCDFRTTIGYYLKRHMRTHTGERPDICDICGKNFPKGGLYLHMRTHGTNKFQCPYCSFKSRWKGHLKSHIQVKHTEVEKRPFKCNYCDHRTNLRENCKKHIRNVHPGKEAVIIHLEDNMC